MIACPECGRNGANVGDGLILFTARLFCQVLRVVFGRMADSANLLTDISPKRCLGLTRVAGSTL